MVWGRRRTFFHGKQKILPFTNLHEAAYNVYLMNLILNYHEGTNHLAMLKRVDFRSLAGPLTVDMERVPFFSPPTLTLLYGIFKLHYQMYPREKRVCFPSAFRSGETDVNRYVQRVNFFNSCPDFERLKEEKFKRHDPAGRFVPITEIHRMEKTDDVSEKIVRVIFSDRNIAGGSDVKYVLSELMDNALQHAASSIGCIVQTQMYRNDFVNGIILDSGIGIRRHLRGNRKIEANISSDEEALRKALEPYVSGTHNRRRDPEKRDEGYHNAGLGLSICCEIMKRSGGFLQLISGDACLTVNHKGIYHTKIAGWPGSFITFKINHQKIASVTDIIKEFDIQREKGHNLNRLTSPDFL